MTRTNVDDLKFQSAEKLYDDSAASRVGVQVWKANLNVGAVHVITVGEDALGAIAVIMRDSDDGTRILLGRHYRAAISPEFAEATGRTTERADGFSLEFPRGRGHEQESAIACACREASEETGLSVDPARALFVGWVHADGGILSDKIGVVIVHVSASDSAGESDGELASWSWERPLSISTMIGEGRIDDSLTLSAWAMISARGLVNPMPFVRY